MDKFDILEAMSGIRDEYIEDAAAFPNQAVQSEEQNVPLENKRGKEHDNRRLHIIAQCSDGDGSMVIGFK